MLLDLIVTTCRTMSHKELVVFDRCSRGTSRGDGVDVGGDFGEFVADDGENHGAASGVGFEFDLNGALSTAFDEESDGEVVKLGRPVAQSLRSGSRRRVDVVADGSDLLAVKFEVFAYAEQVEDVVGSIEGSEGLIARGEFVEADLAVSGSVLQLGGDFVA